MLIHACFVFEERINRPLEQKSLGVQKHEDFKFSEHPVVMLAAPGQGNWDASADRGEASYHGIPITPSTSRTPKLGGFKLTPLKFKMIGRFPKRDQTFYNPWGWIVSTDQRLMFTKATPWTPWTWKLLAASNYPSCNVHWKSNLKIQNQRLRRFQNKILEVWTWRRWGYLWKISVVSKAQLNGHEKNGGEGGTVHVGCSQLPSCSHCHEEWSQNLWRCSGVPWHFKKWHEVALMKSVCSSAGGVMSWYLCVYLSFYVSQIYTVTAYMHIIFARNSVCEGECIL